MRRYIDRLFWILVWAGTAVLLLVSFGMLGLVLLIRPKHGARTLQRGSNWLLGKMNLATEHIMKTKHSPPGQVIDTGHRGTAAPTRILMFFFGWLLMEIGIMVTGAGVVSYFLPISSGPVVPSPLVALFGGVMLITATGLLVLCDK